MRFLYVSIAAAIGVALIAAATLLLPPVRSAAYDMARAARAQIFPEPPPPITPIALVLPPTVTPVPPTAAPTTPPPTATSNTQLAMATAAPTATATATALPTAPPPPPPTATPGLVEINGRFYDAYIPAANKEGQDYSYSCEFDAVWVILQTYGFNVSVDEIIGNTALDTSIEPYIQETAEGALIIGGDINSAFSGDYTGNFLARSTGQAIQPVFERYGLVVEPVNDRTGIEAALRQGALVWMKTTVDFKPWRPATWVMPDGSTHQTVLGNDHAVVVIGFNSEVVAIRDVLGPTSSNWQRPYEYEVDWATFMASWQAQSFDGLAVWPPQAPTQ